MLGCLDSGEFPRSFGHLFPVAPSRSQVFTSFFQLISQQDDGNTINVKKSQDEPNGNDQSHPLRSAIRRARCFGVSERSPCDDQEVAVFGERSAILSRRTVNPISPRGRQGVASHASSWWRTHQENTGLRLVQTPACVGIVLAVRPNETRLATSTRSREVKPDLGDSNRPLPCRVLGRAGAARKASGLKGYGSGAGAEINRE
jgi:hypothetical protein